MQFQGNRTPLFFNWGNSFQSLGYLPRVRYSNAILSPETWNIPIKDFLGLQQEKSDIDLLKKIETVQHKYRLKDELLLVDGDNHLYVNLKHPLSIRSFLDVLKNRQWIVLREFLYAQSDCSLKNGNKVLKNECIIAFYRDEKK